jgi:hypothetical protein
MIIEPGILEYSYTSRAAGQVGQVGQVSPKQDREKLFPNNTLPYLCYLPHLL